MSASGQPAGLARLDQSVTSCRAIRSFGAFRVSTTTVAIPVEGVHGTTVRFHRDIAPVAIADLHGIGRAFVDGDSQDRAGLDADTARSTDLESAQLLRICTLARENGVRRNVRTDRDGRRTLRGSGTRSGWNVTWFLLDLAVWMTL